jgi:hypothetical protein
MSGILSKKLFTNSKYVFQSFTKINQNQNQLILNRFLRIKNITNNENLKNQTTRNYAKLNNRQYQINLNNKPTETPPIYNGAETQVQLSIFKRFKEAYKKHGKVIVIIHLGLCVVWVTCFYFLSKR